MSNDSPETLRSGDYPTATPPALMRALDKLREIQRALDEADLRFAVVMTYDAEDGTGTRITLADREITQEMQAEGRSSA